MKKILILVNRPKPDYDLFVRAGNEIKVQVFIRTLKQIAINYQGPYPVVQVAGQPLTDFNLVYWRVMIKDFELMNCLAQVCLDHSILVYDLPLGQSRPQHEGKGFNSLLLAKSGLPIVPSWLVTPDSYRHQSLPPFPLVAKITHSSQGRGVSLCRSAVQLIKLLDKHQHLLLQPYLPNQGDVRVLVIDNQVAASIFRKSSQLSEFRNNVSLGGSATSYKPSSLQKNLAVKAVKALGYSIAGVDLILDPNDHDWKILEVNRAPQFVGLMEATDVDIPQLIINFLADQIKS